MPPQREVSLPLAALFVALTLVGVAVAALEMRAGVQRGNVLLIILGALLAVFAAFGGYEAFALGTGLLPTISVVADDNYIAYPAIWLGVAAVVFYFAGLLTEHFTWNRGFHWQALVLLTGVFLVGAASAVLLRFAP